MRFWLTRYPLDYHRLINKCFEAYFLDVCYCVTGRCPFFGNWNRYSVQSFWISCDFVCACRSRNPVYLECLACGCSAPSLGNSTLPCGTAMRQQRFGCDGQTPFILFWYRDIVFPTMSEREKWFSAGKSSFSDFSRMVWMSAAASASGSPGGTARMRE